MRIEDALSERDVHDFWRNSRYFSRPLLSETGQTIEVIRRGRVNHDAGPDFLDAVLRVNGTLVQGDIEIHLLARDWYQHGHDRDPAYNRVILHLSCDTSPVPEIRTEKGSSVPALIIPLHLFGLRGPGQQATTGELFDCPLGQASREDILATLDTAARERLQNRVAALQERLAELSWDQLFYEEICDTLGYAKNRRPFRELAQRVPVEMIFSELRAFSPEQSGEVVTALLFGAAGLLEPEKEGEVWEAEVRRYVEPRRALWQHLRHALQIQPLPRGSWQLFRLRPQNFPQRRIAALAELVLRFYHAGMLETMIRIFTREQSAAEAGAELRRFFLVPAPEFWRTHYHLHSGRTRATTEIEKLLGESRASDLVVNTVLPLLVLYGREAAGTIGNRALEVYSVYPALQENAITRKMRRQLGLGRRRGTENGALIQQGMLHLHKMYCTPLFCEKCLQLRPPATAR